MITAFPGSPYPSLPKASPVVHFIRHRGFGDARGWLPKVYSAPAFEKLGINCTFVQDHHPLSIPAFTLPGLHSQNPPRAGQAGTLHPRADLRRRGRYPQGFSHQ